MGDFVASGPGNKGELVLAGSLTVENASAIKDILKKTLKEEDVVFVSVDADALVDISFLQLLCSAHRTAAKLGKPFVLRHKPAGGFSLAVINAGYVRKRGCARDKDGTCLWVGGPHE